MSARGQFRRKACGCDARHSLILSLCTRQDSKIMMGHRQVNQAALFYEFSLERHIPPDHLLRSIDRFVELGELRRELAAFYSTIGRPSIDPYYDPDADRGLLLRHPF